MAKAKVSPAKAGNATPTKKRKAGAKKRGKPAPKTSAKAEQARTFATADDFSRWLEKNHSHVPGVWARFAKKGSKLKSMTYQEAVEAALCYGWIDALMRPENEASWLQRFVPRRPKSLWSRINRDRALALIERGRMQPAGFAEIERAKQDGRWEAAYDSPATATVPADLEAELTRRPRAKKFFEGLDRVNRYAIIWRIQTALNAETRARRLAKLVEMLESGKTLH